MSIRTLSGDLRWRIAVLLDKLPGQCWADLVWWAVRPAGGRYLGPKSPWSPMTSTCRADGADGGCYCGKLRSPDAASVPEADVPQPCQPIGCDNGYHLPGCAYASVDRDDPWRSCGAKG